ncbi:MAG: DUF3575 domain-containing protein [Bacteroidaceae bacterium]|nr:DUF3575 domain-containing protein [Bacteroidaceae bacterium]
MKKYILSLIIAFATSVGMRAQMCAINADAVWCLAGVPNLGVEIGTGNATSLAFNAFGGYKPLGMDAKFAGVQPEFRYWLSGRSMHQQFIGIGGLATSFKYPIGGKVYDGYALGAGVTFGYALKMSKRWVLTFHGSCGMLFYEQKEYFVGDDYDNPVFGLVKANASGYNILPTNLGVTFSYIIH